MWRKKNKEINQAACSNLGLPFSIDEMAETKNYYIIS